MQARSLRKPLALGLLVSLSASLGACGAPAPAPPAAAAAVASPAPGELNALVLDVLRTYPTDGTHGYWWPRSGAWRGCTRTLSYAGATLCEGDPQGRCHCSGLTFEVFLTAWMRWARAAGRPERILDLDLAGVRRLQSQWFGDSGDRRTVRTALVENGLGTDVSERSAARPGDFVQLWRHDGTGHCAVFLAWERDAAGTVTGLRYWSTQKATNGIGERSEAFGSEGHSVRWDELYLVRVGGPGR